MEPFVGLLAIEVRPRTDGDQERLERGLARLKTEDPLFRAESTRDARRVTLLAMGERQLEILIHRLKREFQVEASLGKPWVVPRSGLAASADGEGRYVEQARGRGHYAHIRVRIRPGAPGSGLTFVDNSLDVAIPKIFVGSIEESLKNTISSMPRPVELFGDVCLELYDGSYQDVDSSEGAFWIAAAMALRDALAKGPLVRLAPVMSVEVVVPEACASAVLRDFERLGPTDTIVNRGGAVAINARVPLSRMIGYAYDLEVLAGGRGALSLRLDSFQPTDEDPAAGGPMAVEAPGPDDDRSTGRRPARRSPACVSRRADQTATDDRSRGDRASRTRR